MALKDENRHYLKVLYEECSIFQPEIREAIKYALNEPKRTAELKKLIKQKNHQKKDIKAYQKKNIDKALKELVEWLSAEAGRREVLGDNGKSVGLDEAGFKLSELLNEYFGAGIIYKRLWN